MTMTSLSDPSTLTLRCVLEITMATREFTSLELGTLESIARTGRAYTNEAKHIANELIHAREEIERLRAKLATAAPTEYNPYIDFMGGP